MPENYETTLKNAVENLSAALKDAATLHVATTYSVLDAQGNAGPIQTAAETTIKLDGDNTTHFPIQSTEGNITVVSPLVELHLKNVAAATEYRTKILGVLLSSLSN